jgi:hypothetical protein
MFGALRGADAATQAAVDLRSEMSASTAGDPLASVRLAPLLEWERPRPSGTAALRYNPSVAGVHRGANAWSHDGMLSWLPVARAGLHPLFRAAGQYGLFRATDVAPSTDPPLQSRPPVGALRSFRAGAETGLTGNLSRRHALDLRFAAERSGGLGDQAALLPPVSIVQSSVNLTSLRSRVESVDTRLGLWYGQLALGGTGLLASVSHGRTRHLTRALDLTANLGFAEAHRSELAPGGALDSPSLTGGLLLRYLPAPSGSASEANLSLAAAPEFDRLDGSLHNRLQIRSSFATTLRAATLRSALQWASDVGPSVTPGHILTFESQLDMPLGQVSVFELGARVYQQSPLNSYEGMTVFAGWTSAWRGR